MQEENSSPPQWCGSSKPARVIPAFTATVVIGAAAAAERNCAPPREGWEYIAEADLIAEAARAGEEARRKLSARPVEPGDYDLVLEQTHLSLTIHESIGHGTELDRALGFEANYAGTSFLTPNFIGQRYGSDLLNAWASAQPKGLATIGFDDDAPREGNQFKIMENIFRGYQMAIGYAPMIGRERSNACAYADSWDSFPIQRMPNISMVPNQTPTSLDDLIGGVERGIYIAGRGSYSIDQQRYNFQFGGQLFFEIRNGRIGDMLRDVAYQARAPDFWLGTPACPSLGGTAHAARARPGRAHIARRLRARFRRINVLNTERQTSAHDHVRNRSAASPTVLGKAQSQATAPSKPAPKPATSLRAQRHHQWRAHDHERQRARQSGAARASSSPRASMTKGRAGRANGGHSALRRKTGHAPLGAQTAPRRWVTLRAADARAFSLLALARSADVRGRLSEGGRAATPPRAPPTTGAPISISP